MELFIDSVTKQYNRGRKTALQGFTSRLSPGIYGILGPNGAGKSTLMNLITDQLKPSEGQITYDGEKIAKLGASYRDKIGYMPQQQGIYPDFTARRFLWYMAALKGLKRAEAGAKINELLHVVNLAHVADRKLGTFSGGMKQRILIAQALLNDPELLILDEPTAGLDPKERIRIRNFISTIALNKIVLIATHVVSDIEFIAKEIIMLQEGTLIIQGAPSTILAEMDGLVHEVRVAKEDVPVIQEKYKVSQISSEKDGVWVRIIGESTLEGYTQRIARPNLEDVYLHYFE